MGKGYGRRKKGARPFMPVYGRKNQPLRPEDTIPVKDNETENRPEAEMEREPGAETPGSAGDAIEAAPEITPEAAAEGEALPDAGGECSCQDGAEEGEGLDAAFVPGLNRQLDALRNERDGYLELARRERADFDNYRKRIEREMKEIKRESLAGFLKEFFGPLDDMDRVLLESSKTQSFESLVGGVRIMQENFWRTLAKAGVRKIDAKGKAFDPVLHEAIAVIPSADVPQNTVLEVYDNGYKIDDHVLRPARVVVSREPDAQ